MKSETSLVAQQVRLQHWADQIRDCQNRPDGMNVDTWCEQQGITKANYYYRLRRVREACLSMTEECLSDVFVELPALPAAEPPEVKSTSMDASAVLRTSGGMTLELFSTASPEFIRTVIEAMSHVK